MGGLKVAWVFFVGTLIIVYGFYELYKLGFPFSEPSGEYSNIFLIMFAGLAVSGIGAAYGRHKIKSEYYTAAEEEKPQAAELSQEQKKEEAKEGSKEPKETGKSAGEGRKAEKSDFLVCQKCGEKNIPKARFCDECGTKLGKICPGCGEENKAVAKFCEECGRKL